MNWDSVFTIINVVALIGWLLIAVGPRGPKTLAIVLYLGVGLLCFVYATMVVGLHSGWFESNRLPGAPPPNFLDYNIAGLRNLFMSDGGVVLGWTHYLAFDLFVGQWIAKDADNKSVSRLLQIPVLFLTLMVGPVGLLVWLFVRERRARQAAKQP
ncbi:DUF4281 domain-containing protein [Sphingomonas sp. HDW15A]|uniref:ABA4-like family protein n=1 Tax=Sphingomonas sp. HDW15A TaxID=2714942 RepID=UPI00140C8F24|nr:ABA4-like family protein [Sphingomonas sp. HDW15A]QIK96225.1 DUF4281 domain-containing protein [Sphingomonas sp. HDW15A]